MELSVQKKLVVGFTGIALINTVVFLSMYANTRQRTHANALVAHTLDVQARVLDVLARTTEAQTSARGFLLTKGEEKYASDYAKATIGIEEALTRLHQLVSDNPPQQQRVKEYITLARDQLNIYQRVIEAVKTSDRDTLAGIIAAGGGEPAMAEMRNLARELNAEEGKLLVERQDSFVAAGRRSLLLMLAVYILIHGILLGLMITLHRELKRRFAAEKAVRASEESLSVTLDSIGDGVLATDTSGRVTRMNPVAEQLTGWPIAEAAGRLVSEVFRIVNEQTREPAEIPVECVLRTGAVVGLANHTALIRRDGSENPIADSAAPIRNVDGQTIGVVLVFREVGAERRAQQALEASETLFRAATELTPHGLLIQREGKFVYANPSIVTLLGARTQDDLIGKPVLDFIDPETRELGRARILQLDAGAKTIPPMQHKCLRLDGSSFWGETTASAYEQDGKAGAVVVLHDISAQKEADEKIRKLNEELHDRARDLESVNKELEAFSYSVSHDLRAPLRAIDGFSLALMEDYHGQLDITAQNYLQRVRTATQRMGVLIDAMLNMSRMSRRALTIGKVNLSEIAQNILNELAEYDPNRKVTCDVVPNLEVEGDPELLRNVLQNLLQNAWKFTRNTEDARIEFKDVRNNGTTAFCIRDNGAGFDMKYADKLFSPFQRLHRVDEFEGTGIGLATIQRIVRRHGGKIWADGAVGKGATFYFTLNTTEAA
ncbi:MAG: PAS domain S-box protein [Candidatus Hydrogenedentes bacterium]|nr:PAS domain S-box protein [Candidatus Hydrogenedentota bacterium]